MSEHTAASLAWKEVRSGTLGNAFATLVYETVDAVRRFDRFPPPPGLGAWDCSAVQEVAHSFIAEEHAKGRLDVVAATARDAASFERVLEAAVRNYMRGQARRTGTGAVLRSLTRVVATDPELVVSGSGAARTWSLRSHAGSPPYTGAIRPLVEVAYAVPDVRHARWKPDAKRRPPIAEPGSLRRIVRAVLNAAAAPTTPVQVLEVITTRFPLASGASDVPLTDASMTTAGIAPDAALLAAEAWQQLSDNERLVMGVLNQTVDEVRDATGLSRSTAARAMAAAKAVLREVLADEAAATDIVSILALWSATARQRGTFTAGSTSEAGEEP